MNRPLITSLLYTCLLIVTSAYAVSACLNEIGQTRVSEPISFHKDLTPEQFLTYLNSHVQRSEWAATLEALESHKSDSYYANNRAVALLHLGRVGEAIAILIAEERKKPGEYHTATNLGTAYELNGENKKALQWIKEGITRNPKAHNGSEWLHVKILEAKIALEKDPNWLVQNSVLGINTRPNEILAASPVVVDHLGQEKDANQIEDALTYQLHERLEFIKPPEPVMANLLFDLSRLVAVSRSQFHADVVAAFAGRYGSDQMPWTTKAHPAPAIAIPPPDLRAEYLVTGAAGVVLALIVGITLFFRRRRNLT